MANYARETNKVCLVSRVIFVEIYTMLTQSKSYILPELELS